MALTDRKFSAIHGKTGNDKNNMKSKFDDGYHEIAITEVEENPVLAAIIYQIGQLEEELDYLRTEISANKDKTGISSNQANAITANTAKTGITSQQATSITDNANSITANKTAIGNITTFPGFGTTSTTALKGDTEIPPITVKLGAGVTLTLAVELEGKKGIVVAAVEDKRNRKTYTGGINLTEKK